MEVWINIANWDNSAVSGIGTCVGRFAFMTEAEAIADQERLRLSIMELDGDSPFGVDEESISIKAKELTLQGGDELVPMCDSLKKRGRCD